ncbi:unnamed protein product [marine sediment metagenome]|uniref:Uncharacterized protein n=1 Tax=marine sediment metagenome TaxID=412755 RepID=X0UGA0_9ZZZZ
MKENLPALDDIDLRKKNNQKVVDSIDNIGTHFKELKKMNRVTFIIGGATSLILLLFLGVIIYTAYTTNGNFLDNIVDRDALLHRYTCYYQEYNVTFRTGKQALDFKELMNNNITCKYWQIT